MKLKKEGSFLAATLLSMSAANAFVVTFLFNWAVSSDGTSSVPVSDDRASKEGSLI
jgi:hypothetical protein